MEFTFEPLSFQDEEYDEDNVDLQNLDIVFDFNLEPLKNEVEKPEIMYTSNEKPLININDIFSESENED